MESGRPICVYIAAMLYWYLGAHLHRAITLYTLYTLSCMDILMCIIFTSEYTQHKIGHTKKIPKEYSIQKKFKTLRSSWSLRSYWLYSLIQLRDLYEFISPKICNETKWYLLVIGAHFYNH